MLKIWNNIKIAAYFSGAVSAAAQAAASVVKCKELMPAWFATRRLTLPTRLLRTQQTTAYRM